MTIDAAAVAANVADIRARIAAVGGNGVELVAVTKTFSFEAIIAATAAGCTSIGENYAQELLAKLRDLPAMPTRPEVHFIGRIQSNKVRLLAGHVDVWQTVDRVDVLTEIARRAPGARVFVQVNVDEDPAKAGCAVGDAADIVGRACDRGLQVEGLMTIGRQGADAEVIAGFRALRQLADSLDLAGCSMGMSGDLELAIRAGATHVRVGSALFGTRVRAERDALG